MIVVMRPDATQAQVADVLARIERWGYRADVSEGRERTVIGVIGTTGDGRLLDSGSIERVAGVGRTV